MAKRSLGQLAKTQFEQNCRDRAKANIAAGIRPQQKGPTLAEALGNSPRSELEEVIIAADKTARPAIKKFERARAESMARAHEIVVY